VPRSHRTLRVLAAAAAATTLLSACAASSDVRQAVAQRRAAEAAGGGSGGGALSAPAPVAAAQPGGTTIDTGAAAPAAGGAPAAASTGVAPAAGVAPNAPAAAAAKPGKKGTKTTTATASGAQPASASAASTGCTAAAPAGGNGGATDTGVTATTIKVGGTFFNGGYLDKYGKVSENAARAYFDYINDNGGICGRKIQYVTCDTAGTADGTTGCLTKLANQDKVFIMGPSLDFNLDIVQPTLARLKLPWVGSSGLYQEEFESPWMYPTQLSGPAVGALIAQYSVTKLNVKKIGVSFLNDVAGPTCTAQVQKVATANGAQVVKTTSNTEIETSLDSQVATLKNAGVDSVLFCNDPVNTVKFIQAAQRVGWKPTFVGGYVAADDVPQAAGSNGKGMYGFSFWDFYKSNTPGVQKYRQITEYYFPQTFHHFYEQACYVGAEAIVEALRKAGPHLTRTDFLKSLKSMTNFDSTLGLKLNFSDLKGTAPSGVMLKADDNLVWQLVTSRFGLNKASTSAASGYARETMPAAVLPERRSQARRASGRRGAGRRVR
jgi:ABC-type branched-subunit amino acid transport system substrate-binding protein